ADSHSPEHGAGLRGPMAPRMIARSLPSVAGALNGDNAHSMPKCATVRNPSPRPDGGVNGNYVAAWTRNSLNVAAVLDTFNIQSMARETRPRFAVAGANVTSLPPITKRVLLIGWDAADWKVMTPLLDAGEMPHLERLIN